MQKGFITKNNEFLVKNIESLLKNNKFDKVYATKFVNNLNSQYVKFLNWSKMCDAKSQEFAVTLPDTAVILEKTSYALPTEFVGGGTKEVFLCGTDYDACLLAIAYQLFDKGIQPRIILDCTGSASNSPLDKNEFIKLCRRNFGEKSIV